MNNSLIKLEDNNVICEIPYKGNIYVAFTYDDIYKELKMNNTERYTQKLVWEVEYKEFNVLYYLDNYRVREELKIFISHTGLESYTSSIITMMSMIGKEEKEFYGALSGAYKNTIDESKKEDLKLL